MEAPDKAYIAGIIDGEGSIMLTKFHKNQHPSPCLSIASTSLELLLWIKDKTGYGDIKSKKNYNIEKHQDSYVYTVKYNNAIELLNDITPYLVIPIKKQRAELILSEYKVLLQETEDILKSFYNKNKLSTKNSYLYKTKSP